MIPLRVYLKNFLCHGEQEFAFAGHPVWLLHGPNGVGKSAVFDGIIYALFGESNRRQGCRTAVADLIRYGESSMRVEFDFEYRGRRYRAWRTRTRTGQPRQGVGEFQDGDTNPRPLLNVNRVDELDQWVCDTLGLNYDAFVSAVLLRQGAAERLIDADREARRDLFRGILDLDPYIRLYDAVTTARTEVNGEIRTLRGVLQEMTEVTEEQITTATANRDDAMRAWEGARSRESAARDCHAHARIWDGLSETCRTVRLQLAVARDRAERAQELERSVRRLRELRIFIPALARISELRQAVEDATETYARLTSKQVSATDGLKDLEAALKQEQQIAATHRNHLALLNRDLSEVTAEGKHLQEQINQAERAADLHRQLDEERSKQFDPDLDAQLAQVEQAVEEAQSARDSCPHLEVILRNRDGYRQAVAETQTAANAETTATADVARLLTAEGEAARFAQAEAEAAEAAGQAAAVATARLNDASALLTRFCADAGESICARCRQPIGPEHVERERSELERSVRGAEEVAIRRKEEARRATVAADASQRLAREREDDRGRAETALNEAARNRRDAVARANAARTSFDQARAELTPEVAGRVGGIDTEGFPAESDVNHARETGRQLPARTSSRNEIHDRCRNRDTTAETIRTLTQAVSAVGAPADVTEARAELTRGEKRFTDLDQERTQSEQARLNAEQAERDLVPRIRDTSVEVNRLAGEAGRADADAGNARRHYDDAVRDLPVGALTWDRDALADDLRQLEEANVEHDFAAMADDCVLQAERERQLAEAERQIAEQVPPDSRRPSAEVQPEVAAAEQTMLEAERIRNAVSAELAELSGRRERREEIRRRLSDAEQNHALHDRLADLLGHQGIQLDLVRHAERRIIELANVTLGQVSRGELRFEPPEPTATQPLELSVRRAGCPDPIPVGNLSGGQRCRVAIALALAVCRFACGESQPLQSVIIDEAFANLDRGGRMAMIDVLRDDKIAGNMLRRIIVVSHHDDVAAAFPVGYRLENNGGVTTATPFGF